MDKIIRVLVTAGSTKVPIDKVRVISNIFKGRTGTKIANKFSDSGCLVTLITSSPGLAREDGSIRIIPYSTYQELSNLMESEVKSGNYDVIIHSAAVSDYEVEGMFIEAGDSGLIELDKSKKVSSQHKNIFMKLKQTEKIIDKVRNSWGFEGILVKFKLEVGISDKELIEIAKKSMKASRADIIVANCLEWANKWAFMISDIREFKINRFDLPAALYRHVHEHIDKKNLEARR